MITIVCGEDSVSSRSYITSLRDQFKSKDTDIYDIAPDELTEVLKSPASPNLFGNLTVYFITNLNKHLSRGSKDRLKLQLKNALEDTSLQLVIWEEGIAKRELKLSVLGSVKEFKPSTNVFQLIEACYPGNRKNFLTRLEALKGSEDEMFLFVMISRHIRKLLMVANHIMPDGLQSWQTSKLKSQAQKWTSAKLNAFYDGLYRAELLHKNGRNPSGLAGSIEILATYYL